MVKQLRKTLHCVECIDVLINKECKTINLICVKNRGALIQPSNDVIIICKQCEKVIRHALYVSKNTLTNKFFGTHLTNDVLKSFLNINIFEQLRDHTNDQLPLENHIVHLIRAIIQKYIKIRLHYLSLHSTNKPQNKRHIFNKIILFQGM